MYILTCLTNCFVLCDLTSASRAASVAQLVESTCLVSKKLWVQFPPEPAHFSLKKGCLRCCCVVLFAIYIV